MHTILRRGDSLPTVGVLQVLLNRQIEDKKLTKDGIFGSNTHNAVVDFQRRHKLKDDGIVGENTWTKLITNTGFKIFDCVDITEPKVGNLVRTDLLLAGGNPITIGYMSNGIEQVVQELLGRLWQAQEVLLVRFYGHGSPGIMAISDGTGEVGTLDDDMAYLGQNTVTDSMSTLRMLAPYFGLYSSVELHGCRIAKDIYGKDMIRHLAYLWNVPVTAGIRRQWVGGGSYTFRFEGPVYTAFPGYISLKEWASHLPDMPEYSMA